MLVFVIIYIVLCLLVGSAGSDRKIGFFPAFIFSLILSPLIGWLITLAYPKLEKVQTTTSPYDKLLKLGMNSYHQGHYEASIKIFSDAILKFNTKPEAYLRLAAVYAKQGQLDLAINDLKTLDKNFEKDFKSFFKDLQIFSHQKIKELQLQNTHS